MTPYQQTERAPSSYVAKVVISQTTSMGSPSRELENTVKALNYQFEEPYLILHLARTSKQLDSLCELSENWNGYEVLAPNHNAIEKARAWIKELCRDIRNKNLKWISPHVSANEDGDVSFEWAKGIKRLDINVSPEGAWYLKSWGTHIVNEMLDGEANSSKDRISLWSWFTE